MKICVAVTCVGSLILLAPPARAQERCYDELGHKIPGACDDSSPGQPSAAPEATWGPSEGAHRGFFLRMTLGGGPSRITADEDLTVGKFAGAFDLEIGGALADDFALHGFLLSSTIVGPTLSVGGVEVTAQDDVRFGTSVLGMGATYYLPWNLYVDAGLGVAVHTLELGVGADRDTSRTDRGAAVVLALGKEWMVSRSWGLGLVLKLLGSRIVDQDGSLETTFKGGSASVAFSATYF